MNTCNDCAHGTHMRAKSGESLDFVACKLSDDQSRYVAGRMECTRNAWKESSSAPQPPMIARSRAGLPAAETAADAEREWWGAT